MKKFTLRENAIVLLLRLVSLLRGFERDEGDAGRAAAAIVLYNNKVGEKPKSNV